METKFQRNFTFRTNVLFSATALNMAAGVIKFIPAIFFLESLTIIYLQQSSTFTNFGSHGLNSSNYHQKKEEYEG